MNKFPKLYKIDTNNKERVWKCWVKENILYRRYGLVEGKKTESQREFEGKNIGKANETSPEEQAYSEATKEWVKHIDKGYKPKEDDHKGQKMMENIMEEKKKSGGHNINAVASANSSRKGRSVKRDIEDTNISTSSFQNIIPMKANVWELEDEKDPTSVKNKVAKYFSKVEGKGKSAKLLNTEFFAQAKLDGWRAVIRLDENDEVIITSNSGKQYPFFTTLRKKVKRWLKKINKEELNNLLLDGFDGELFSMNLYEEDGTYIPEEKRFSTICSMCGLSRSEPHILEDQIQFHIFDLVDLSGKISQTERFKSLEKLFDIIPIKCESHIVKVPTQVVENIEEVPKVHDEYASLGYEGVVLRSYELVYLPNKRSNFMRKYKHFIDHEYEVIGAKRDKGVEVEYFVWVLKNEDGEEFSAKPIGTREEKKEWYKNKEKFIGKFLTVKFQEFTETGVPRFPVAKNFRGGVGKD